MREETGEAGGPLTSHLSGSNGTGQAELRQGEEDKKKERQRETQSLREETASKWQENGPFDISDELFHVCAFSLLFLRYSSIACSSWDALGL